MENEKVVNWYTTEVLRTWDASQTKRERIMHAALGLVGEVTEFVKSGRSDDEGGDVAFYFYALSSELGIPVDESGWSDPVGWALLSSLLLDAGSVAELVKKQVCHNADVGEPLKEALDSFQEALGHCLKIPIEEIKQLNKAKLRKRYPDGFSFDKRCDSCGGAIDEHYTSNRCMQCDLGIVSEVTK